QSSAESTTNDADVSQEQRLFIIILSVLKSLWFKVIYCTWRCLSLNEQKKLFDEKKMSYVHLFIYYGTGSMTGYLASDTVEVTKHPGVFGLSETEAPFTADMAADGILGFVASFDVMRVFDNVTTHGVVNSELGNKVVFGGVDSGHYTGRTTCICLLSATYCWINRDGYDENTKSQQNIKDCGSATSLIVGQTTCLFVCEGNDIIVDSMLLQLLQLFRRSFSVQGLGLHHGCVCYSCENKDSSVSFICVTALYYWWPSTG
uniref:Peptidase A1 domain-containing protein n=1 Tax=Mola mola TaxID=94237 RepID=A0A3Q4AFW2_MOLML